MNSFKLVKEMVLALERNKSEMLKDWLYKQSKSQLGRLYKEILAGKVKNDNEAAVQLGYKSEQDAAYRKLKTTFKDKLEDLFLYVELKTPKGKMREDYVRSNLNKQVAAWQNMSIAGANNVFADKGEALYKKAKEYGSTRMSQLILDYLIGLGEIIGDKQKYKYYNEEKERVEKTLAVERLGGQYFSKFQKAYKNTKASKVYLFDEFEKDYERFLAKTENLNSPLVIFYQFLLKIQLYSISNSHKIVFETAKEGAAYFAELSIIYVGLAKFFNHYLIEGYAKIKDYEKVEYYALENLDLLQEGQNSWFKTYELYTFATLHLGHHEKAAELLQFIKSHELYENQQPMLRDNLGFMDAHLFLLHELGKFKPTSKEYQDYYAKPFRVQHFMNDLEVADADKQGLVVVHILMEISFKLIRKEEKGFLERVEAIDKFFQRNTELEGHERVLAFFRLVQLGIKHNWRKEIIHKYSAPYYDVFDTIDNNFSNQCFDMEFVLYPTYFDFLCEKLAK